MPNVFLYTGEVNPNDVKLRDPLTSGAASYTLACAVGVFIFTGISANFIKAVNLTASVQTYTLTGNSVTLTYTPNSPYNPFASNLTTGTRIPWLAHIGGTAL